MSVQSEVRAWLLTLAGVVCLGSVGYEVYATSTQLRTTSAYTNVTLALLNESIPQVVNDIETTNHNLNGTLTDIRHDLKPIAKQTNLNLQEMHRVILEAGLTAMEARKASAEERAALPGLTRSAQSSINQLTADLANMQQLIGTATNMLGDPHIPDAIAHTDATMTHVDGITGDFQHALHPILNPEPCKTRKCKLGRAWKMIIGATSASEGVYWTGEIFKEIHLF